MLPARRENAMLAPFGSMFEPFNRLERLFERVAREEAWGVVPLSMWEDDEHVYVEAELPGMTESEIEVTVHSGILHLSGERKPPQGRMYLYDSRSWGRFERAISLPSEVSPEGVRAHLDGGLLTVTLTKNPETRPRRVEIQKK